jgi:tyrosinase
MRVTSLVTTAILASAALAAPSSVVHPRDLEADRAEVEQLTESIRAKFLASLDANEAKLRKRGQTASCTAKNLVFRRE